MNIRARLTLTGAVLLVGAVTTACGGDGAPTDASEKDFCETQSSFFGDLLPDDMANPEVPTGEEMARAVKDWGKDLEEVGTPDDIPDDARAGFERLVEQAQDVDVSDFSIDRLEDLQQGGAEASEKVKNEAQAFADYLTETCGNPLDDLDLPQLPEMPDSTQ
jgi:hypothetical protein